MGRQKREVQGPIFGGQEDEKEPANDTEKEHPVQWEENQERVEDRKPGGESSSRNGQLGQRVPRGPVTWELRNICLASNWSSQGVFHGEGRGRG